MKLAGAIFICVLGCALVVGFNKAQQQETQKTQKTQRKKSKTKTAKANKPKKNVVENKTKPETKVVNALVEEKPKKAEKKVEDEPLIDEVSPVIDSATFVEDESLIDEVFGGNTISEDMEMDLDSELEAELEKYKVDQPSPVANVQEKTTSTSPKLKQKKKPKIVPDLNTDRKVKVIFKAGNHMVGVVKKDQAVEKKIRGVYRSVDDPKEYGAGLRLWYVNNSTGFIFLPYTSIASIEKLEVVSVKREHQKSLDKSGTSGGSKKKRRGVRRNNRKPKKRVNKNRRGTNRARNRVRSARAAKY